MEQSHPSPGIDQLLGFTLPERQVRGRLVRLGASLEHILAAHAYPPAIRRLLSEALVLTALMGGLLKDAGSQLTLQVQSPGAIAELLVCDYLDGGVRGYVKHDPSRIDALGPAPSLGTLFGEGSLTITFERGPGQRYQGVVPLEAATLAEAIEQYFARSEQVPTLVRLAVDDATGAAGGLLVQYFPEGEADGHRYDIEQHADWDHVEIMAGSVEAAELVDAELPPQDLVWRLFHEEQTIRVQPIVPIFRGCRCSIDRFEQVLARFSHDDRRDMRDENGVILVNCEFCSREFPIQD